MLAQDVHVPRLCFAAGWGNVGGTTHCNLTLCASDGRCSPELDSQNSAVAYGPLTAANFTADYQVIAWSGAGLDVYTNNTQLGEAVFLTAYWLVHTSAGCVFWSAGTSGEGLLPF